MLEPALAECLPAHATEIARLMPALREEMLQLVAANVPDERRRSAHDKALAIFRELRALFGVGA